MKFDLRPCKLNRLVLAATLNFNAAIVVDIMRERHAWIVVLLVTRLTQAVTAIVGQHMAFLDGPAAEFTY